MFWPIIYYDYQLHYPHSVLFSFEFHNSRSASWENSTYGWSTWPTYKSYYYIQRFSIFLTSYNKGNQVATRIQWQISTCIYNLCSDLAIIFEIPCAKKYAGDHAFSAAGPHLWNELPVVSVQSIIWTGSITNWNLIFFLELSKYLVHIVIIISIIIT